MQAQAIAYRPSMFNRRGLFHLDLPRQSKKANQMNTHSSSTSLMADYEVDREMQAYFKERAEDAAAERAKINAAMRKASPAVIRDPFELSPALRAVASQTEKRAVGVASVGSQDDECSEAALSELIASLNAPEEDVSDAETPCVAALEVSSPLVSCPEAELSSDSSKVSVGSIAAPTVVAHHPLPIMAVLPIETAEESKEATDFTAFPVSSASDFIAVSDPLRQMTMLCRELLMHND